MSSVIDIKESVYYMIAHNHELKNRLMSVYGRELPKWIADLKETEKSDLDLSSLDGMVTYLNYLDSKFENVYCWYCSLLDRSLMKPVCVDSMPMMLSVYDELLIEIFKR